jgi:hypothetical protein
MSYTINKTNGTTLTLIVDGSIDQTSTDLTLIGKNSSGFGTYINDNFVWLLENFANTSQPNHPITGQLWFDTSQNRLKVYDGSSFKVSGGTIVANSAPSSLTAGDIWIDSLRGQLYFNDGLSTKLAGPTYTSSQGVSGLQVTDILDTSNINHTIVSMYVAQTLIGIYSKDSFTPQSPIPGFTGSINTGFNVGNYTGVKYKVPVTQADSLLAADGSLKTAASFVATSGNSNATGTITIQNATPLILGTNSNTEIGVTNTIFQIKSNTTNQNFSLNLLNGSGLATAIFANATTQRIGIYTNTPSSTLDVAGDVTVQGNLNVLGTTTTISTTNLVISDKLITLGSVVTPTDTTANGAGIEVPGATTKTFTWVSSTPAWTSSDNLNLVIGKSYKINGFDVVTGNSLGSVITSAPGLTTVGTLTSLNVSNVNIATNVISATQSNADLVLTPNGSGTVNMSSKRISSLANPVSSTDGANKTYVDASIQTAPTAVGITTTGFTNAQIASNFIAKLYPVAEHANNALVRAFCTDLGTTQVITAGSFLTGSLNLPIPINSPASLYNPIDVINTGLSVAFSEYAL